MKIFLSYPSVRRELAERLKLALEAEQHDVFFDRDDLAAGQGFHRAIRDAVDRSDLCIFLVAPESVAPGSYTLAELGQVQRRWPQPAGRVLPLLVAPTPRSTIPAYLLAVTLFEPRGEPVAETVAAVAHWQLPGAGGLGRKAVVIALAVALAALALGGVLYERSRRAAIAERERQVEGAREECGRDPATAFAQLELLAARADAPAGARAAREDCAMAWLRRGRVPPGMASFETLAERLKPVLLQGLASGAAGARAAELRAHLGWADALRWQVQRNPDIDPEPQYRQALALDPGNAHAHAMWAHWMLRKAGQEDEALAHFDAAVEGARRAAATGAGAGVSTLAFVRRLQLGAMVTSERLGAQALRVLDQMRRQGEVLDPAFEPRIWSYLYASAVRESDARRLLDALSAADGLQTFLWLFPRASQDGSRQAHWRLLHGLLLTQAGRASEARPDLLALQQQLRASGATGSLLDAVDRLLSGGR